MSGGLYNLHRAGGGQLDPTRLMAYGDTMNDGKVQLSFTLPIPCDARGVEAARALAIQMGIESPDISHAEALDTQFSFYVVCGTCIHSVDYTEIRAAEAVERVMTRDEIDDFIREHFRRKLVFVGASTGTDAHTVGIDAIMNQKGFAGHYGLERYRMVEAHNLGAQVENADFIDYAVEHHADVLLVSQTVTQGNVHLQNLTDLIERLEARGLREQFLVTCGGARITQQLAKELGYDAGFGQGKFSEDVATFSVEALAKRHRK